MTVPAGVSFTATNAGGGPTTIPITPGPYYQSTLVAHVQAQLNALRTPATWTVTLSTGANGTGQVSINWASGGGGTYSIAWTASGTTLRNVLGFTADLTAVTQGVASVSPQQAKGLWLPDCPMFTDGDRKRAPLVSDLRTTTSPRGLVLGLIGNTFFRHTNVRWSHVPIARTWEAEAALVNASFELFFKETQLGLLTSWFSVASLLQVYDHSATKLGIDANGGTGVAGWQLTGLNSIEPKRASGNWTGLWTVSFPELVSGG